MALVQFLQFNAAAQAGCLGRRCILEQYSALSSVLARDAIERILIVVISVDNF
jgi:hypothetical protein